MGGAKQLFSLKILVTMLHRTGVIPFTELYVIFSCYPWATDSKSKSISYKLVLKYSDHCSRKIA